MTSIGKSFSKKPYSFTNKDIQNEINHSLSPQCNKKNTKHFDAESISLNTSERSTPTVQMYLRIRPAPTVTEGNDVYRILNPTTLLTKFPLFPSFEGNCRNPRSAKLSEATGRRHAFTKIFGSETSQAEMFEQSIKHRVADFLGGKSSTIMTYGTRDSGKTYTLFGTSASPGIIPRSIELVFSAINCNVALMPWYKLIGCDTVFYLNKLAQDDEARWKRFILQRISLDINQISAEARRSLENSRSENTNPEKCNNESIYAVWLSYVEIYNGYVYDLLRNPIKHPPLGLEPNNGGQDYIRNSEKVYANTALEACEILLAGQLRMRTVPKSSNTRNSRSHTIFTMTLLRYQKDCAADEVVVSTLTFYDLASSTQYEMHQKKSHMQEASTINNSLLVLNRCLKAVSQNQVAPFRESTLTNISQRALSGLENLSLIVNVIFPSNFYVEVQNILNFCTTAGKLVTDCHKKCKGSCGFEGTISSPEAYDSDVITSSSVHQTPSETAEMTDYIDSAAYKSIQEQNRRLMKEMEKLRKKNRAILCEKNKCSFELTLITEKLKKFQQLTRALICKWDGNSENIDADCLVNNLERLMDEKVRRTEKKLEEMKEKNSDAASKVVTVKQELSKLENDTLIKMRKLEEELSRKEAYAATLKHYDPTLLAIQTYVESMKKKSLNISDIDRKSLFENSGNIDCSVSRSSDRSSKYDSGVYNGLQNESQRSISVSDSIHIYENEDKCTQICSVGEDSVITVEKSVEQLKMDRIDSKRQNHEEMLHIAELSQDLETIRNVIYALNEAACTNERKIIQHECQLFQKETLEQLTEEEREIAIKRNDLSKIIKNKMQEYKHEISELTRKLAVKEENEDRAFKCLEKFIETKFIESKLSLMRCDQLNKES